MSVKQSFSIKLDLRWVPEAYFYLGKGPIVYYVLRGGGGFGGGGTILKQAPFWGVNFSLVRNMRGVKFYDTATAV